MKYNLSKGNLFRNMLKFSLPFLLSYFLQTLYGMADLVIAGQFYGAEVISAVSIGSQIMHMLTVMIVGLAMGSTVLIGQRVGAEDRAGISRIIGNTMLLFTGIALISTLFLTFTNTVIVRIMRTPVEAINDTENYLRICFLGIPFIIAYNILSSVFRGLGDSKSPMKFIMVACLANILLDYLFMGAFGMRASGAALATVISQLLSVLYALYSIRRRGEEGLRLRREDFRISGKAMRALLGIGFPIMCQDGFIQVSFLLITVIANQRGVEIAAAVGIVEKLISFLFLVPSTMLSTVSTIAAQNLGAGERQRAEKVLFYGIGIAAGIGLLFAVLFQFISAPVFALFTSDEEVRAFAVQYMSTYVLDCMVAGIHFPFSGYFSASNRSILSFIHNFLSVLLVRVPGAYLATVLYPDSLYAMGLAAPLGSLLSAVICVLFYVRGKKKIISNVISEK